MRPEKLASKLLQLAAAQDGGAKSGKKPDMGKENAKTADAANAGNAADDAGKAKSKSVKTSAKTPATNGPAAPANTANKGETGTKRKVTSMSRKKGVAGAHSTVSRKVAAMGKAAAIATDALKRPSRQFEVDEEPSDHGSMHKHEGGRPAKRRARAELASRFEAAAMMVATPGAAATPMDPVAPEAVDADDGTPFAASPSPVLALPAPAARQQNRSNKTSKKTYGAGGRFSQYAEAAAAAAAKSTEALGARGEKVPAGRADGAWSSAYRTLQAAHIKLQSKYDRLKDTKLAGLIDEVETYRAELADHGSKAEELINHFRGEAMRQREAAEGAEGVSRRAYDLERENAELKETLLAYQGKILRMEQEAAVQHQQRLERVAAEASAGGSGREGGWGSDELEAFTGLSWSKQAKGIHHFRHEATGFQFQLSAVEESSNGEQGRYGDVMSGGCEPADEVSFVPLEFGAAEGCLPGYLSEAIEFERCEMPKFVGRMLTMLNQVAEENEAGR